MYKECKCGSTEFFVEKNGNQTGLYCSKCGRWFKWLTKDEIRLFKHNSKSKVDELMERINQSAIKVSTVSVPHTYMKAVGTKEIERIVREVLSDG